MISDKNSKELKTLLSNMKRAEKSIDDFVESYNKLSVTLEELIGKSNGST